MLCPGHDALTPDFSLHAICTMTSIAVSFLLQKGDGVTFVDFPDNEGLVISHYCPQSSLTQPGVVAVREGR